jgi:hypothetical protein
MRVAGRRWVPIRLVREEQSPCRAVAGFALSDETGPVRVPDPYSAGTMTFGFSDLKRTEDGPRQKLCKTSLSTLIAYGPCDSRFE